MSFTTGFTQTCSLTPAGLQKISLISAADFTSAAKGSGVQSYATLTLKSGAALKTFEFEQDYASMKEDTAVDRRNPIVTHTLEWVMSGLTATSQDAMRELIDNTPCGIIAVAKDNAGVQWLIGYSDTYGKLRPRYLSTGAADTAKALSETSAITVTLTSVDNEPARVTTASIA